VVGDPRCGGAIYAHITYDGQVRLKADIIRDALARLARLEPPASVVVTPSPERGYRMRSRLHLRDGHIGFFLEGTHQVCHARESGQLLPETTQALDVVAERLDDAGLKGSADIEVSENKGGDQRAVHVELAQDARLEMPDELGPVPAVSGLSWSHPAVRGDRVVFGSPFVADDLAVAPGVTVNLRRHVQAFFQGNRFLIDSLVASVAEACPAGPVLDLYAGAGLFGVCLAATGRHQVTAVEGHPLSAADLAHNAKPCGSAITVCHTSVERFVQGRGREVRGTLILDPPRTGMTREAMAGALRLAAPRVVFVSCDVATFARDARRFVDAGYALASVRGFDLFPNTAHVEVLAVLTR